MTQYRVSGGFKLHDVLNAVRNNVNSRFHLMEEPGTGLREGTLYVRALQGHTLRGLSPANYAFLVKPCSMPELIYHSTSIGALPSIKRSGVVTKRTAVHCCPSWPPNAEPGSSGGRKEAVVVIEVERLTRRLFYLSGSGALLLPHNVPPSAVVAFFNWEGQALAVTSDRVVPHGPPGVGKGWSPAPRRRTAEEPHGEPLPASR
jgi:RNA:NAD 2'-phosphotransferase (TPT1/KptA family)